MKTVKRLWKKTSHTHNQVFNFLVKFSCSNSRCFFVIRFIFISNETLIRYKHSTIGWCYYAFLQHILTVGHHIMQENPSQMSWFCAKFYHCFHYAKVLLFYISSVHGFKVNFVPYNSKVYDYILFLLYYYYYYYFIVFLPEFKVSV